MDVPPVSHPAWKNLVSGKERHQFEFLATNLLLGYLALQVKRDSSSQIVQKCAQELHDIFVRNADLISVQRDLIKVFGKGALSGYLYDVLEVKSKITRGEKLLLAGDDDYLDMVKSIKDFTGKRIYGAYFERNASPRLVESFDMRIPLSDDIINQIVQK